MLQAMGKREDGSWKSFNIINGILNCIEEELIELNIPKGVKEVYCKLNKLIYLIVPKGVKKIDCALNQLTVLKIPDNIEYIHCAKNKIDEIILQRGFIRID